MPHIMQRGTGKLYLIIKCVHRRGPFRPFSPNRSGLSFFFFFFPSFRHRSVGQRAARGGCNPHQLAATARRIHRHRQGSSKERVPDEATAPRFRRQPSRSAIATAFAQLILNVFLSATLKSRTDAERLSRLYRVVVSSLHPLGGSRAISGA